MTEPDLLYPAIFVFVLMIVGLGLTIREFSQGQLNKPEDLEPVRGPVGPDEVRQPTGSPGAAGSDA